MLSLPRPPPDPVYTFHGTMGPVFCTLVREDTELLYAGTNDGCVHIWDLKTKREVNKIKISSYPILNIVYKDGMYITQIRSHGLVFWIEENNSWKQKKIILTDYMGFCPMAVLDDLIYLPDNDNNVVIFDAVKNKEIVLPHKMSYGYLNFLKAIPSMDQILAVFELGNMVLFDKTGVNILCQYKLTSDVPMAVDFCEETKEGIVGTTEKEFYKFKVDSNNIIKTMTGVLTNAGVSSVSINKEGSLCVLGCRDGRIRYYSMKKLKLLAVLIHHSDIIHFVHFVNTQLSICNKGMVVASSKDQRVSLWNLYTSKSGT